MKTIDNEATQLVNNNESTIVNNPTPAAKPAQAKTAAPAAKPAEMKDKPSSTVQAAAAAGVVGAGLGASAALFSSAIPVEEADITNNDESVTEEHQSEPTVTIAAEDVHVASSVNDSMSFNEAFAAARHEVGPDGVFEWRGQLYNTHIAGEENHTPTDINVNHDPVAVVEPAPAPEPVPEPEPEVEILGIFHDDNLDANVGVVTVDGQEVFYVDVDNDQTADIMLSDLNHDGQLQENEVADISGANIDMANFDVNNNSDLFADNLDTPDYVNDGDVDMFA